MTVGMPESTVLGARVSASESSHTLTVLPPVQATTTVPVTTTSVMHGMPLPSQTPPALGIISTPRVSTVTPVLAGAGSMSRLTTRVSGASPASWRASTNSTTPMCHDSVLTNAASLSMVTATMAPPYSTMLTPPTSGTAPTTAPLPTSTVTPRRGKAPPVDAYTGEDLEAVRLEDWLPTLERAATWNGWTDEERLMQLAGHLRGRALAEWNLVTPTDISCGRASSSG